MPVDLQDGCWLPSAANVEKLLACPECRGPLFVVGDAINCRTDSQHFAGTIADGVVLTETRVGRQSFFDDTDIMKHCSGQPGVRHVCYAQQMKLLESYLAGKKVILDVGCGPALPYKRDPEVFAIGLDLSYESVRYNMDVDMRIFGTATRIPLPDRSVDTVICIYSIHHMVGHTITGSRQLVDQAFGEYNRVLKPDGDLFLFEVTPWWPVWILELAIWNLVRKLWRKLDMFFWSSRALCGVANRHLPPGAIFRKVRFEVPWWTMFSPMLILPALKVPRLLSPFEVCLYHWHLKGEKPAQQC